MGITGMSGCVDVYNAIIIYIYIYFRGGIRWNGGLLRLWFVM